MSDTKGAGCGDDSETEDVSPAEGVDVLLEELETGCGIRWKGRRMFKNAHSA